MTEFFRKNILELVLAEGEEVIQEDGVGQLEDGQGDDNVECGDEDNDNGNMIMSSNLMMIKTHLGVAKVFYPIGLSKSSAPL